MFVRESDPAIVVNRGHCSMTKKKARQFTRATRRDAPLHLIHTSRSSLLQPSFLSVLRTEPNKASRTTREWKDGYVRFTLDV